MITEDDFFDYDHLMSLPYSKEGWAVMPTKPLPENEEIANFLKAAKKSFMENPGIPLCSNCLAELELNEKDNICCPHCKWEIIVEKE